MWRKLFARLEREVLELIRLLLLIVVTIGVIVGGYLFFERYLLASFRAIVDGLSEWWQVFSLVGLWKNVLIWFGAMFRNWLIIEIPKRLAIVYLVPVLVLALLPGSWLSAIKRWLRRRKEGVLRFKTWFIDHAERWFGRRASLAITAIFALLFFLLFYFVFSAYVVLWWGFITLPKSVVWFFSFLWGSVAHYAQKLGFRQWAFGVVKWFGKQFSRWLWPVLVRLLPDFHWFRWLGRKIGLGRKTTETQRRKKKLRSVRWAIRRRYRNAAWLREHRRRLVLLRQHGVRGYRKLVRQERQRREDATESAVGLLGFLANERSQSIALSSLEQGIVFPAREVAEQLYLRSLMRQLNHEHVAE